MRLYIAGEHEVKNGGYAYISGWCADRKRLLSIQNRGGYNELNNSKLYLAGENNKTEILKNGMKLYLAETESRGYVLTENERISAFDYSNLYILESFYYLRKNIHFEKIFPYIGSLLIDSGAFTFMSDGRKTVDWDKYTEEYAQFINKYDIKLFFELDIDTIVGLKEVERLRAKLETLTGKKCIPVWHKNRGKDYFIKMCQEYPYVALGGIVAKEIPVDVYETAFPWFIKTAHQHGAKIHGLGYTRVGNLQKYHFDSVDSTAWLYGNRSGFLYLFNEKTGIMEKRDAPKGSRVKARQTAIHNFNEWIKLQRYADKKL